LQAQARSVKLISGASWMSRRPSLPRSSIPPPTPENRPPASACLFADLAEGLREARPDGIVIATPNQLHVPNGLTAVQAGIPMLLEKPVSGDLESAMELVTAAEAAGVPILVGHHRRHSPLIQRARAIVESGRLGQITAVTGLSLFQKPNQGYFDGPYSWRREPGAGVVLINLIHVVDDLRNISDAAVAPWSWELTSGENKAYPHTDQFCYLVAGTKGSLAVPRLDLWSHEGDGWQTPIQSERSIVPEQDPLTNQMRHFCQVIRREVEPVLDGRGGTRTLETTLGVKRAAETGELVRLS
jgi:predicted dehydrogenase